MRECEKLQCGAQCGSISDTMHTRTRRSQTRPYQGCARRIAGQAQGTAVSKPPTVLSADVPPIKTLELRGIRRGEGKKWASAGKSSGQGTSARGGSVRLPGQSRPRRNARDHPVRRLTLRCHAWARRRASTQLRCVWASPAKPFAVHEKVPSDVSWNVSRSRRARSHFFGTKTRPMSRPAIVTFPVGAKRVDHVRKVAAANLKRTFGILPVEYLRVGLSQPMLCATKDVCTKPVASPGARPQAARTKS
jgi:hypothetical protein